MRPRGMHAIGDFVARHARGVAIASVVVAVACGVYAGLRTEFEPDREALINPDLAIVRRTREFRANFRAEDPLLVVVEPKGLAEGEVASSAQRERMRAFARRVRERLGVATELSSGAGGLGLLYLPLERVEAIAQETEESIPILQAMKSGAGLPGWMAGVRVRLDALAAGDSGSSGSPEGISRLARIVNRCAEAADPSRPPATASDLLAGPEEEAQPIVGGGRLLLILLEAPPPIDGPLARAREAVSATLGSFPDLSAGVTGRLALQVDEMKTAQWDLTWTSILSAILVAGIQLVGLRSVRGPLLILLAGGVASAVTLAFAAAAYGRLNLLSSVFGIVLVSVGFDYGIHVFIRYQAGLKRGMDPARAMRRTFAFAGEGLIVGALTTAAAFFSPVFSDFLGLWELGSISGVGILVCLVVMLTTFPAFLLVTAKSVAPGGPERPAEPAADPFAGRWSVAWALSALLVFGTAGAAIYGAGVGFDHNLLHLLPRDDESAVWERRLIQLENRTSCCVSLAPDLRSLAVLREAYRARPDLFRATECILPEDEERKRGLLAGLAQKLEAVEVPSASGATVEALRRETQRLRVLARSLAERDARGAEALGSIVASLDRLLGALPTEGDARVQDRLRAFETEFVGAVASGVAELRRGLHPGPVCVEALAPQLASRFVGKDGRLALRVYPAHDVWEFGPLEEFAHAVEGIDPEAVGAPLQMDVTHQLFLKSFRQTVLLSAGAIFLVLLVTLRSLRRAVLAASPLAAGVALLLAGMRWFGVPFNFANFFAIPILIGSGVDHGVHLVHSCTEEGRAEGLGETWRAIVLTVLTTVVGFATLMGARHPGLASLGGLIAVGSALTLATSVCVPAVVTTCRRLGWRV